MKTAVEHGTVICPECRGIIHTCGCHGKFNPEVSDTPCTGCAAKRPDAPQPKKILALDFDGVIHMYRNGWKGPAVIDDDPVPGAKEFIERALEVFDVQVYSARSPQPGGIAAMQEWMRKWGFPVERIGWPANKPATFVIIDDQAFQFNGAWPDLQTLVEFVPWNRRKPAPEALPCPKCGGTGRAHQDPGINGGTGVMCNQCAGTGKAA